MPRPTSSVWEYFLTIHDSGGKKHVVCSFCNTEYKHAMAFRLKQHILLNCKKCPQDIKTEFKPRDVESVQHFPSVQTIPIPEISPTVTLTESNYIQQSFQSSSSNSKANHDDIDIAIARAMYASGVQLSLLESEYWKHVFHLLDPTYQVPTRYALSNKLLDAEYSRTKQDISKKIHKSMALALIVDGWTNINGKGVINFIITTPEPIFYNATYPETNRETGEFIADQISNIINEIGPEKFIIVVTDNARNMKAAWSIIKRKFHHISCVGCVSHTLNLIYKDIMSEIGMFKAILDKVLEVIKYVKQKHVVLAMFEKCQAAKYGNNACSLKLYSKTRWSGAYITIESYKKNREALEQMALSHEVVVTRGIKIIILDTEIWLKIDEIVNILQPLAVAVLSSEWEKALLSDVFFIFKKLKENILQQLDESVFLDSNDKDLIIQNIDSRKEFCIQPIHFAAYLLDPRYCGNGLSDDDISKATEYIQQHCVTSGLDEVKVLSSMAEFKSKVNFFHDSKAIWIPAKKLEPRVWWQTFALNQCIGSVATKVLSVPPSSAASERNWSTFSRTRTKLRNRLKQSRVLKLVSIRSNLNLSRKSKIADYSDDNNSENSEMEPRITSDIDPLA